GNVVIPCVSEKALTFKKKPGFTPEKGSLIWVGRTISQLQTTLNGNPDRALWMIFNCQPLTNLSARPLFQKRCPLPNGRSMIASAESKCGMSSDERPLSASRLNGLIGPERPPLRLSPSEFSTPIELSIVRLKV